MWFNIVVNFSEVLKKTSEEPIKTSNNRKMQALTFTVPIFTFTMY